MTRTSSPRRPALLLAAACSLAFAAAQRTEPFVANALAADDTVTYGRHVAPILLQHCATCHRPNGAAPFSLLRYEDAVAYGPAIVAATASRRMPPWLPRADPGTFVDERRLDGAEIALIGNWVRNGMARGDPLQPPPVPEWKDTWQLGPPDLVVTMPTPYQVPSGGGEIFRNFVIPVPVGEVRYVEAVELRPTNHRVLHHAMIMVDRTAAARTLDERDPAPGFESMITVGNAAMPEGFFLGWTPGRFPFRARDGLAWRLAPGDDLVLQFHLRPTAQTEAIAASVGLYFADRPPTRRATVLRLGSETIDIPAGQADYVATDEYVLPVDVQVLGLYPHAHYLATEIEGFAILPDDSRVTLIDIPQWDFNWQDVYRFTEPRFLPRGTRLVMRYTYDNSAGNPRNPSRPPRRVIYGPTSRDEMGDLWVQVVPRDEAGLIALQRDFTRKSLARQAAGFEHLLRLDPHHRTAHGDLANTLRMLGDLAGAVAHYRAQVENYPDDGNAHYNLGTVFQSRGDGEAALRHYREALRIIPNHAEAHNNLGVLLQTAGALDTAVAHYRRALRSDSTSADARNNLGIALIEGGRIREGLHQLRQAARWKPTWAVPVTTLAWVLATHASDSIRDAEEAVWIARRAVRLTGNRDPGALNALAAAYAAAGAFDRAVATADAAIARAEAVGDTMLLEELTRLRDLYRQGRPYHDGEGEFSGSSRSGARQLPEPPQHPFEAWLGDARARGASRQRDLWEAKRRLIFGRRPWSDVRYRVLAAATPP